MPQDEEVNLFLRNNGTFFLVSGSFHLQLFQHLGDICHEQNPWYPSPLWGIISTVLTLSSVGHTEQYRYLSRITVLFTTGNIGTYG